MLYSKTTNAFYDPVIHASIPSDAVKLTDTEYSAAMEGQALGKVIKPGSNGKPMLANPPAPTAEEIAAAVTNARAAAYAKESDPLFFKAQRGEGTMEEWMAKVAEIKARYPDGVLPV